MHTVWGRWRDVAPAALLGTPDIDRLDWRLLLTAALAIALAAAVATLRLARRWERARGRRLSRRGHTAEHASERLLERAGYRVLERQPRGTAHVIVDGVRLEVAVYADFLVARGGRRLVVEVKSGAARRATQDTVRRQLLEYALAYDAHGLLLVDARGREIHEIGFEYT